MNDGETLQGRDGDERSGRSRPGSLRRSGLGSGSPAPGSSSRRGLVLMGVLLAAGATGCASQSRPCLIIPAQIELAQSRRDKAKKAYDERLEEVTRALNNLEASRGRLQRLEEERQELFELLGDEGGQ